jgi:hypothetical protein
MPTAGLVCLTLLLIATAQRSAADANGFDGRPSRSRCRPSGRARRSGSPRPRGQERPHGRRDTGELPGTRQLRPAGTVLSSRTSSRPGEQYQEVCSPSINCFPCQGCRNTGLPGKVRAMAVPDLTSGASGRSSRSHLSRIQAAGGLTRCRRPAVLRRTPDLQHAWLQIEAPEVAAAYDRLVRAARSEAGEQMKKAWTQPPPTSDEGMILGGAYPRGEIDAARSTCSRAMCRALGRREVEIQTLPSFPR